MENLGNKDKRKKFVKPEMEVEELDVQESVIVTSVTGFGPDMPWG